MFFAAGGDIPFDRFIAPRVEVELAFVLGAAAAGARRDARRRARRDRGRDAGGRDHRRAHRAVRPRDEGAAQGVRHDRRLRRQRRHRHRRPAVRPPTRSTCAGSARCSTRTASIEETGLAAARARPPGQRRRLAGQQDRAVRRAARAPATSCSAARSRGRRPRRAATSSTSTTGRSARSTSTSSEPAMKLPVNTFKAALGRREAQIGLWLAPRRSLRRRAGRHRRLRLAARRRRACAEQRAERSRAAAGARAVPGQRDRAAGRRQHGADQAVPRHRRADAARADGDTAAQAAEVVAATRYRAARACAASAARSRALRAGTTSRATSSTPTQEICVLVQVESPRGSPTSPRSPRSKASTASSSARPTCRRRWATSATPAIPTCWRAIDDGDRRSPRRRQGAGHPRDQPGGVRAATSRPARCSSRSASTRRSWRAARERSPPTSVASRRRSRHAAACGSTGNCPPRAAVDCCFDRRTPQRCLSLCLSSPYF